MNVGMVLSIWATLTAVMGEDTQPLILLKSSILTLQGVQLFMENPILSTLCL